MVQFFHLPHMAFANRVSVMKHLGVIRSELRVHILSWVTATATGIPRAVVHQRLSGKWPQQVALVASTAVLRISPCRLSVGDIRTRLVDTIKAKIKI